MHTPMHTRLLRCLPKPTMRARALIRGVRVMQNGGPTQAVAQVADYKVLHVGCGPYIETKLHEVFRVPGWSEVRLDIDPKVNPDIVCSITDMAVIPSASHDAVWSSHNVEHLYWHEVGMAFGEFARVLKPTGFVFITMPDLQAVARFAADDKLTDPLYHSPKGPITPLDIIYGHRGSIAEGNQFMAHRTGFSARSLAQALRQSGFSHVEIMRGKIYDLWALAYLRQPPQGALRFTAPVIGWDQTSETAA